MKQEDGGGLSAHGLQELPSIFETDIASKRPQPADHALFSELAHVESGYGGLCKKEKACKILAQICIPRILGSKHQAGSDTAMV